MAQAEDYAKWIVENQNLKGTDKFNTVAQAYQEAKAQESLGAGQYESVMPHEEPSTASKLSQSIAKGATGLVDLIAGAPENYKRLYQYATTPGMPVPRTAAPTQTYLTEKGILTPEKEFNTPVGRVADFATQLGTQAAITGGAGMLGKIPNLPSYQALKSLGGKALMTGGQGIIGGTANELMNETGNTNPLAQALVTGAAIGAPGAIYAMRNTPATMVNQSISHLSPTQLTEAQNLVDRSRALGAPITGAEAISQVTGGNKLSAIQRYVENQPRGEGAQIMSDFMDVRPEQNKNMAAKFLREMSPTQPSSMEIPPQIAGAAGNVIKQAESELTQKVQPYYEAAGMQTVPKNELTGLLTDSKIKGAIDEVKSTGKYGVKGLPDNDFRTLIAAKQLLDDQYSTQMNAMTGAEKNAGAVTWGARQKLDNFIADRSPNYAEGRDIYSNAQSKVIQPLKTGTVGELAKTEGYAEDSAGRQRQLLMPISPKALNPEEINKTVALLKTQNPDIARQWTAQNLQSIFDEASREKMSGGNQFGGANFVKKVMGNEGQKSNLEALITSSAGPDAWKGFQNMTEVMQAQGQRMPANSATAFNSILTKEMESGGPGAIVKNVKTAGTDLYQAWRLSKNTEMLAKMLTDPKSVDKLKELAKTNPESKKALNIVNTVLGGYTAQKPEIGTEENK